MFTPIAKRRGGYSTPVSSRRSFQQSSFGQRVPLTPKRAPQLTSTLADTGTFHVSTKSNVPILVSEAFKNSKQSGFISFSSRSATSKVAAAYIHTQDAFICWSLDSPQHSATVSISPTTICSPRLVSIGSTKVVQLAVISPCLNGFNIGLLRLLSMELCADEPSVMRINQSDSVVIGFSNGKVARFDFSTLSLSYFSPSTSSFFKFSKFVGLSKQTSSVVTPLCGRIIDISHSVKSESEYYILDGNGDVIVINQSNLMVKSEFRSELRGNYVPIAIQGTVEGPVTLSAHDSGLLLTFFKSEKQIICLELRDKLILTALRKFSEAIAPNKSVSCVFDPRLRHGLISIGSACFLIGLNPHLTNYSLEIVSSQLTINHFTEFYTDQSFLIGLDSVVAVLELKNISDTIARSEVVISGHSELVDVIMSSVKGSQQRDELHLMGQVQKFLSTRPLSEAEIQNSFSNSIQIITDSDPVYWSELGAKLSLASTFWRRNLIVFQ
ncbi:hypothetical protein GEMRC1_006518 [Eukaryota sp. GEM-RC1]